MNNDLNHDIDDTNDDAAAEAARLAKVAALQQRRSAGTGRTTAPAAKATTAPAGRKGVAQGSKIAITALSMSAMFAIVGVMGAAAQQNDSTPAPTPTAAPQIVVVIHQAGDTGTANGTAAANGTVAANGTATASQPVVLTAQPVVRQAPASQAPAAKSNGSR